MIEACRQESSTQATTTLVSTGANTSSTTAKPKGFLLPHTDPMCQALALPLGAGCGLMHCRVEEGIAEEIQGATEDDPGIVPGLESRNQESVLPHCVGVLGTEAAVT